MDLDLANMLKLETAAEALADQAIRQKLPAGVPDWVKGLVIDGVNLGAETAFKQVNAKLATASAAKS